MSVGERVGPYVLRAQLGRGGFGTVWRADDTRGGPSVALKVLHRELAADASVFQRFVREAYATSAANNEHVVRVLDAGTADGHAFIALELLEGETLLAVLKQRGALPAGEAVDIAVQILDGLRVAHEAGVVHRDLKPANIFLARASGGFVVKILDFGVGRIRADLGAKLTETGTALGTPHYMAPEQAMDASRCDHRADLYSTAVVLYALLSGRLPYGNVTVDQWVHAITRHTAPPPVTARSGALPAPLVDAVRIGLAVRPEERWQSATAFANALVDAVPESSATTRVGLQAVPVTAPALAAPQGKPKRFDVVLGVAAAGSPAARENPRGFSKAARARRSSLPVVLAVIVFCVALPLAVVATLAVWALLAQDAPRGESATGARVGRPAAPTVVQPAFAAGPLPTFVEPPAPAPHGGEDLLPRVGALGRGLRLTELRLDGPSGADEVVDAVKLGASALRRCLDRHRLDEASCSIRIGANDAEIQGLGRDPEGGYCLGRVLTDAGLRAEGTLYLAVARD